MANVFDPHRDEEQDRPPFLWQRARLGRQARLTAVQGLAAKPVIDTIALVDHDA